MIDNKIFSGGKLNVDDDLHLLPKSDWVDARNVRINSSVNGYLGSFVNIKGTQFMDSPTPIGDNDRVVGARGFDAVNKIFYFTCDPVGDYDRIIEFNATTNTFRVLVENITDTDGVDVLNFSPDRDYQINHIGLVDEKYLFWTDNLNAPRMLDIDKDYGVITEQSISVIKYAPTEGPTQLSVIDNPTINANKIKNKNYQFKYRWIYWDESKSAFSPVSAMSNQQGRAIGALSTGLAEWYESSLTFNYQGGGDLVKGVEIIAREGNDGDWAIIDSFLYDKSAQKKGYAVKFLFTFDTQTYNVSITYDGNTYQFGTSYTTSSGVDLYQVVYDNFIALGLTGFTIEKVEGRVPTSDDQYLYITSINKNIEFTIDTTTAGLVKVNQIDFIASNATENEYLFSSFQPVAVIDQAEANRPYDYVPLRAGSMALPNGNYLAYGDYTEGYDNIDLNATASLSKKIIVNTPQFTIDPNDIGSGTTRFTFDGLYLGGEFGCVITRYTPTANQYTVTIKSDIFNETKEDFINRVAYTISRYEGSSNVGNITSTSFDVYGGTGPNQKNYLAAILSTDVKQSLKSGDEYQYGIVYIDAAGRYGAVQTNSGMVVSTGPLDRYSGNGNKDLNGLVTVFSRPPLWAKKYAIVRTKRKKKDFFLQMYVDFITYSLTTALIDVQTSISKYNERYATNVSYSWVEGDRIQFIWQNSSITGEDVVYDTAILGVDEDGNLIVPTNSIPVISTSQANGFYEIYRESAVDNSKLFWEIADFGDVGNYGQADAYHIKINDDDQTQSASTPEDIPLIHYSKTGDIWYKQRFIPSPVALEPSYGFYNAVWCESPSFSDFNCNAFTTDIGRANIQNAFERQTTYPATIRHSLGYVQGTQINNINVFYEENYRDYSTLFGPIQVLDVDGSALIIGQQLRMGEVQIFQSLITDNASAQVVGISDELISRTCRYYDYEAGIGNSPESYVRYGSNKYFVDRSRGLVCRLANNGITPISITGKMNSYFVDAITPATYVNAGYDPSNNEYVVTIRGNDTVLFSENSNGFTSFIDIMPTRYATLRQNIYSFDLTGLYKLNATEEYNTFFGVPYDSSITIVSNDSPAIKKSFIAVSEIASSLWEIPEITTDLGQESRLGANKFATLEGEFHASFMRDSRVTPGVTNPLFNGNRLKGKWIKLKLKKSSTDFVYLLSVGIKSIISPQTGV